MQATNHGRGRKVSVRRSRVLLMAATIMPAAGGVLAPRDALADRTYTGPISGNNARWNLATNWTPAGIPAAEQALITSADSNSRTVLFDANANITRLIVNQTGVGFVNTLSQTHATAFTFTATIEEVIGSTGSGAYVQTTGTNDASVLILGQSLGSNGTYTLSGGELKAGGGWTIGLNGNGTFVQSGGSSGGGQLHIAANGGATGSYALSGGSVDSTITEVGGFGAGTMSVANIAVLKTELLTVGYGAGSTFTQTGGTVAVSGTEGVRTGVEPGGVATVNLSGGVFTAENFGVGGGTTQGLGYATVNISGTADVRVNNVMAIWAANPAGTNFVNLSGGSLSVGEIANSTNFNWTGGTLHLTNSTFDVGPGAAVVGSQVITAGMHLITGSAAQLATGESSGVSIDGLPGLGAGELLMTGGSIEAYGSLIASGQGASFRQSGGDVATVLTAAGTAGTASILQTGGTHTADITPLDALAEQAGLGALALGLNPDDVGTYTVSGTAVLNVIGGANLGGRANSAGMISVGGTGTLNVTGGEVNITGRPLRVINGSPGSRINLSGGRLATESIDLMGNPAALNWTGGTFAITASGGLEIGAAGPIGNSVNLTPGKTLEALATLRVTPGGAIVLAGGAVRAGALDLGGDPSRLNWSGGKLELTDAPGITIGAGAGSGPGASMTIPAGGTLATPQLNLVFTGSVFVANGGRAVVDDAMSNGGDVRLGGGSARISSSFALAPLFNSRLLRGDGQVDLQLHNQATGEVRATGNEQLRFTNAVNTNDGRINLVNGGMIEFTGALTNEAAGQITGRGTLAASMLTNHGTITFSGTGGESSVFAPVVQQAGARLIATGNSTVTFYNDVTGPATSEIRVSSGSTAVFMGSATGNFTGGGTKIFDGPLAPGAPAAANVGLIASVVGDTVVESNVLATRVREDELEVNGQLTIAQNGTAAGTSRVNAITVGVGGRMDLKDNKLIVAGGDVGTFDGVAYTGISGMIQRGYNFSAWDGDGLVTTMPDAGPTRGVTTLAVATADEVFYAGGNFGGVPVASADVLVMYTYAGDVNLDGVVDGADYGTLDNWIQFPGTAGYVNGDVNYDGVIDGADYGVLDNSIQLQGAPIPINAAPSSELSGVSAVPEPAGGFALLTAAAAARLSRRRRRR